MTAESSLGTIPSSERPAGFTLVEMVMVVSIVAILASIALPSYRDHVVRSKIPDAVANLAIKRAQLEQFFQDNGTYLGAPACGADTATSAYFDFSCAVQTASAFTLRAAGKSSMAGFGFAVDQNNTRTTAAVPSGWTLPSPNNCWVTRKGGVC
jgi:type IV pilus assembly protein PilE